MLAALLTATVLCATPPKLTVKLSAGSFVGSVWAAQSYREVMYRLRDSAVSDLMGRGSLFDSPYLIYGAPVLGPWMTLARGGAQARDDTWLLVTSGLLQGVGISALTYQLVAPNALQAATDGLQLAISPYVAGRLGLTVTLTGW